VSTERELRAFDGLRLHVIDWIVPAGQSVHGQVFIVHGIGEHAGRYGSVAQHFNDAGWNAHGVDLRGWGLSGGLKGHVDGYEQYAADLKSLLDDVPPASARFAYGHSLGALILMTALRLHGSMGLAGAVLSAPPLRHTVNPPRWKVIAGRSLARVLPTLRLATGLDPATVSRVPEVVANYRSDPLNFPAISARGYTSMLEAVHLARTNPRAISLPSYWIQGGQDMITDPATNKEWAARLQGDVEMVDFPEAFHEVHNEPEGPSMLDGVIDWMHRHTRS
jgi:alpha-beta hydrolase superfamily lysophospholipase